MKSKDYILVFYTNDKGSKMRIMFEKFSTFNDFLVSHPNRLIRVKYSSFVVGDDNNE